MARVLAFDVNETLLDLSSLDRLFEESFGDAGFRPSGSARCFNSASWAA